jgi:hypothetical protein
MDTLQDYAKRCDELLEAVVAAQGRAAKAEDALGTAQRGFDDQIAIMTEVMTTKTPPLGGLFFACLLSHVPLWMIAMACQDGVGTKNVSARL